tara:strand:+ start:1594 stop:3240 length:1647 start_codon:yes stop_codon:yes gene_type:complete
MAIEKIGVEFQVNGKQAVKAIKDTTKALDSFNTELSKNREGMQLLDQLTGGAVSQFQDYQKSVKGGIGAVKSLTTSFKGLKTAILSTGIGAIVVALALIVTYWEDIKELVSGVSKEQEDLLASQQKSVAASQAANDAISATANTLKLQGKSERDILNMKKLQTDETIKSLEAQLLTQKEIKNQQIETAQRNKSILQGIVAFLTLPITLLLGSVDAITQTLAQLGILDEGTGLAAGFTGGIAEMVFNPDEIEAEADKAISETEKQLTKLKNTRDGFILQQQDQDKAIADKKKADKDKEDEEEAARVKTQQDKDYQEKLAYLQKIEDAENKYFDSKLSKEQQEENAVRAKYFNLIEAAKTYGEDTKVLEEAQAAEIKTITDKAAAEDKARDEAIKKQKLASVGSTFGDIANILGKNSAAGKSAAIAQATINAYQGVSEVWGNKSVLPEPFATAQKVVSSVGILASGLQTVKQIKQVPKPQGVKGGSGGGGGSPSGGSAPAFNIVGGNGGTNQLADTIAEQTNKPSRSYVVASDVSTAQEMDRNTIEGASL